MQIEFVDSISKIENKNEVYSPSAFCQFLSLYNKKIAHGSCSDLSSIEEMEKMQSN